MYRLIEHYINKLTKEDIIEFSIKNDIILNNDELIYLYKIIKEKYKLLLNGDTSIFNEIKDNININTYNKIIELYNKYKNYL